MEQDRGDRREIPLVAGGRSRMERTAVVDGEGAHAYDDLLEGSRRVGEGLRDRLGGDPSPGTPIPFLVPPDWGWIVAQWGIWRAGAMAVPLAVSHPPRELAYVLDDADPPLVVAATSLRERIEEVAAERGIPVVSPEELRGEPGGREPEGPAGGQSRGPAARKTAPVSLPGAEGSDGALMIYTSGTTGRPKGVVHTHDSLDAQARTLIEAWGWREDDRILLILPLHHLHGIMNVVHCALRSGASCHMLPGFDARESWERIAGGTLSVFMGVPTVYHRMVGAWEEASGDERTRWAAGARAMRLMVSGSAALPAPLFERWEEITGHRLLERYGMSETGMILSNPLEGPRISAHVGHPLPGVQLRLVDEDGTVVGVWSEGEGSKLRARDGRVRGGVQVRGPGLFREYWRRPDATTDAFTADGWFRTGDVALWDPEAGPGGSFRLLGRRSVDILKTGGYKVSALEIESILLEHPGVAECAVVGVAHPEWGQQVCAAMVEAGDGLLDTDLLREWLKERLAPYKVPTRFMAVEALPRNAMGKVQKPAVTELFSPGRSPGIGPGTRDGGAGAPSP